MRVDNTVVSRMAALAVNASAPMGMGFIHWKPEHYFTPADFDKDVNSGRLSLDYVEGRMVKLRMSRDEDGLWTIPTNAPRSDYQSWCSAYPTYEDLAKAGTENWV